MLNKEFFESIYKLNESDEENNIDYSYEFGYYYTETFIRIMNDIPGAELDYEVSCGHGAKFILNDVFVKLTVHNYDDYYKTQEYKISVEDDDYLYNSFEGETKEDFDKDIKKLIRYIYNYFNKK